MNTLGCRYNEIQYDMLLHTSLTEADYKLEFEHTKDTPYLALAGELWGVFCEDFGENGPHYNGTALQKKVPLLPTAAKCITTSHYQ